VEGLLRTDPLSMFTSWWVAVMAMLSRRFDRVIEVARHMVALDPTFFLGHWALGMGQDGIGESEDAVDALRKAHELSGGIPITRAFLAYACGRAGLRGEARALLDRAEELAATSYMPPSTFAFGHVGLGDWDAAFEWLDRAIEIRDPLVMPIRTYVFLDPVRTDPRYHALLKKMRLE